MSCRRRGRDAHSGSRDRSSGHNRGLVTPEQFTDFAKTGSDTHRDLAILYARYQARLEELNLADPEEFNRLAISLMQNQTTLAASIDLRVVDGFDSFTDLLYNPYQG